MTVPFDEGIEAVSPEAFGTASDQGSRNSGRNSAGRFVKGNPGRPKGVRNRTAQVCERLMMLDVTNIVNSVLAAARNGDMTAAKIILDRVSPVRKGRAITFDLPEEARTAEDISMALGSVVGAMSRGMLTPEEAATVASVLDMRRKSIETAELEARVRALEIK